MGRSIKTRNSLGTGFGNLIRLAHTPVITAVTALQNAKRKILRQSVWKTKQTKAPPERNRRILDIACINYDESYVVGNHEIDTQHKLIMMLYNNIVADAIVLRRSEARPAVLAARLGKLISMIGEHFAEEEQIMFGLNYNKIELHKMHHDQFMSDILMMTDKIKEWTFEYEQMIFYIGSWFSGHMLVSDKEFGEFYLSQKNKQKG